MTGHIISLEVLRDLDFGVFRASYNTPLTFQPYRTESLWPHNKLKEDSSLHRDLVDVMVLRRPPYSYLLCGLSWMSAPFRRRRGEAEGSTHG